MRNWEWFVRVNDIEVNILKRNKKSTFSTIAEVSNYFQRRPAVAHVGKFMNQGDELVLSESCSTDKVRTESFVARTEIYVLRCQNLKKQEFGKEIMFLILNLLHIFLPWGYQFLES